LQRKIEETMAKDDKTTTQLQAILASKNVYVSLAIKQTEPSWTCRGTAYCQLIRQPNEQKRTGTSVMNLRM
jgi:hypothetical protein